MEIKLTPTSLEISRDGSKLSLRQGLDPDRMVVEVSAGKQTVTYSAEELELRAMYEMLKRRFG